METHTQVIQVDLARRCSELVELVDDRQKVLHALDLAIAKLQRQAEMYPMVSPPARCSRTTESGLLHLRCLLGCFEIRPCLITRSPPTN